MTKAQSCDGLATLPSKHVIKSQQCSIVSENMMCFFVLSSFLSPCLPFLTQTLSSLTQSSLTIISSSSQLNYLPLHFLIIIFIRFLFIIFLLLSVDAFPFPSSHSPHQSSVSINSAFCYSIPFPSLFLSHPTVVSPFYPVLPIYLTLPRLSYPFPLHSVPSSAFPSLPLPPSLLE